MKMIGYHLSVTSTCMLLMLSACLGSECEDLSGKWYNQLGSVVMLSHTQDGELTGTYQTQVKRHEDSTGNVNSHKVFGAAPYEKRGSVFGFAVVFNGGGSTCAWTGQCHMCDGKETLMTSWVLRSRVATCVDKWKSTLIGQDTFVRDFRSTNPSYSYKRAKLDPITTHHRAMRRDASDGCRLNGYWYNKLGSQLTVYREDDDSVRGKYHTYVERSEGAAGSGAHSPVYGITNWDHVNSTLAMFVVWNGGESITGWVGQCHMCGNTEVLETTWLLRSKVETCSENWMATLHGENGFTRENVVKGPGRSFIVELSEGEEGEVVIKSGGVAATLHTVLFVTLTIIATFDRHHL